MIFKIINYINCYKIDVFCLLVALICIFLIVIVKNYQKLKILIYAVAIISTINVLINFKQKFWLSQLSDEEYEFSADAYNNYISTLQLSEIQYLYIKEMKNNKHGRNATAYLSVPILLNMDAENSSKFFQTYGYPLSPFCSEITPVRHFRDDKNPYMKQSTYFSKENAIKAHQELTARS